MISLPPEQHIKLKIELENFDPIRTIPQISGLLTVPHYHANTFRIELLVHYAVLYCKGNKSPHTQDIERWLNKILDNLKPYEDPSEDVFIENVITSDGNRKIFTDLWDSTRYSLQIVLDVLSHKYNNDRYKYIIENSLALLKLSDSVVNLLNLPRWHSEESNEKKYISIIPSIRIKTRANYISFSKRKLIEYGILSESLSPFICTNENKKDLKEQLFNDTGDTILERKPLILLGDIIILAIPGAISVAIRKYIIEELSIHGQVIEFNKNIISQQAEQIEKQFFNHLNKDVVPTRIIKPIKAIPDSYSWLIKYDFNKYIHVMLLNDNIHKLNQLNFSTYMEYSEEEQKGLEDYIEQVAKFCKSQPDYREGFLVLIFGGIGRGFGVGLRDWPREWGFMPISISNLLLLSSYQEKHLDLIFKLVKQKKWSDQKGIKIQNFEGLFLLYCYWRENNYRIIPKDLKVDSSSTLLLINDFTLQFRKEELNNIDFHAAQTVHEQFVPVYRLGLDSYFDAMRNRPIYVSPSLSREFFSGVVETKRGSNWLILFPNPEIPRMLFELWEGLLNYFEKILNSVENKLSILMNNPIEIRLDFQNVNNFGDFDEIEIVADPVIYATEISTVVSIEYPYNTLKLFEQSENEGERYLFKSIAQALLVIFSEYNLKTKLCDGDIIDELISDTGIRLLHAFEFDNPIDYLIMKMKKQALPFPEEDMVFTKLKIMNDHFREYNGTITEKEESTKYLNKIVIVVLEQIKACLSIYDRKSIIERAMLINNQVMSDREHWRRTASAIIAIYAESDDVTSVAINRESKRVHISAAVRVIIEIANCECQINQGKGISDWEFDELIALVLLVIEAASDSDAIHWNLIEPKITIHENKEYEVNRDFYYNVIHPFQEAFFEEEFYAYARRYNEYYEKKPSQSSPAEEIFSPEFINAFKEEYKISLDDVIDGLNVLIEYAIKHNKHIIIMTVAEMYEEFKSSENDSIFNEFLDIFGLYRRPQWDVAPEGYSTNDLIPWRYDRRLSIAVKPIVLTGKNDNDMIMYSVGLLRNGIYNFLSRIESGRLPQEMFTSQMMIKYWGTVNDQRGHEFEYKVDAEMKRIGWNSRAGIQMTELGAPEELGNIDVLVWNSDGDVLIIECKRLRLARNISEIARICAEFRGEAKDKLRRHIQRYEWIKRNLDSLYNIVGFIPDIGNTDIFYITNTHVPMMYIQTLPIPLGKILPFDYLEKKFA